MGSAQAIGPDAPSSRMRSMLASISVFEPTLKRLILLVGEGRVEVLDGDVRRRDQHRLGVGERIEAVLDVVVAHSRCAGAAERHGLNNEVNVYPIHSGTTGGQLADESVYGLLIAAEDVASERPGRRRDPLQGLVEGLIGEDR